MNDGINSGYGSPVRRKERPDIKRSLVVVFLFCCLMRAALTETLPAEETSYLTGQLLVAAPEMSDPRFVESVIYIIRHDETGALGLVINRPLAEGALADLLRGLRLEGRNASGQIVLHYGGPVEPERAFILHSVDYTSSNTRIVGQGVAVTADVAIIRAIAEGKGPSRSLFCVGYAGWTRGQLEGEIKANGWFAVPADEKLIFEGDPETKWERAMARRRVGI